MVGQDIRALVAGHAKDAGLVFGGLVTQAPADEHQDDDTMRKSRLRGELKSWAKMSVPASRYSSEDSMAPVPTVEEQRPARRRAYWCRCLHVLVRRRRSGQRLNSVVPDPPELPVCGDPAVSSFAAPPVELLANSGDARAVAAALSAAPGRGAARRLYNEEEREIAAEAQAGWHPPLRRWSAESRSSASSLGDRSRAWPSPSYEERRLSRAASPPVTEARVEPRSGRLGPVQVEQPAPAVVESPASQAGVESPASQSGQLGPQVAPNIGRKTLVLDLDETLVHSSFRATPEAELKILVEIEGEQHSVYVRKRPGVDEFLQRMTRLYEVVVYTASMGKYANPLIDELDPGGDIAFRLFREACTHHPAGYMKDLSKLGRDLADVIIIDNSPVCYALQPENAIPIQTWRGDTSDKELLDLIPILCALATVEDIPSVLRQIMACAEDDEASPHEECSTGGGSWRAAVSC